MFLNRSLQLSTAVACSLDIALAGCGRTAVKQSKPTSDAALATEAVDVEVSFSAIKRGTSTGDTLFESGQYCDQNCGKVRQWGHRLTESHPTKTTVGIRVDGGKSQQPESTVDAQEKRSGVVGPLIGINDMDLVLLSRIRAKVDEEERRVSAHYSGNASILVPVATEDELEHVEKLLGFRIHPFLRELYLSIGNGGFGPGCSVFGTRARELGKPCFGVSSFGGLVETFRICSADYEEETGQDWPPNLLPFIEFGCGLFGAVDSVSGEMYRFQGPDELEESGDTIDEFFENWLSQAVSDLPKGDQERRNGVNPFTGKAFEYRGNKGDHE